MNLKRKVLVEKSFNGNRLITYDKNNRRSFL